MSDWTETNIGMIRSHWKVKPFKDFIIDNTLSYGVLQPGSYAQDGVSIIRGNNIKAGRIDITDVLKVSKEIEAKYMRTRLQGGQLLIWPTPSGGSREEIQMKSICCPFHLIKITVPFNDTGLPDKALPKMK